MIKKFGHVNWSCYFFQHQQRHDHEPNRMIPQESKTERKRNKKKTWMGCCARAQHPSLSIHPSLSCPNRKRPKEY